MVNDTIEKEEEKSEKKAKDEKKKLPKEISQEILKQMFKNLLRAVGIMLYFIILNLAHSTMNRERLVGDIEIFASVFLIVGIFFLERAYKREQGGTAITGIEFLMLSIHSLLIMHVTTLFKYDFKFYLLTSSYVISIYYVLKAIVLYTKGRKEYLNSLSDISEIVKKQEPVKKEAKKRSTTVKNQMPNEDNQGKKTTSKKTRTNATKKTTKAKTKTNTEEKPKETKVEKKKTKAKSKTIQEKPEEAKAEKKSSKAKSKTAKEEKAEEMETKKKKATKTKASTNTDKKKTTKTKTEKEEKEEPKTPEKKKRGRPKKEVTKSEK